jgi:hypothetical protein
MFGVVHACRQSLGDELIEQWRAHLCGLCLSLRDSRGQLSRALTNTDAVLLSVLVEAQQPAAPERTGAGPCPLRGLRTAQVVPAAAVSVRLGATASLTLGAAKAGDAVAERQHGLARPTVRNRAIGALAGPLRRGALLDAPMAESFDAPGLLDDLRRQGRVEAGVREGDSMLDVTAPTAQATGRIFASSAALSGCPENTDQLREIGEAFGVLAHLLDAVDDLERDRRAGSFNPITATGTPLPEVRRECARQVRRIRLGFDRLELRDGRLARALLVDGTHAALHRAFGTGHVGTCSSGHASGPTLGLRAEVSELGMPGRLPIGTTPDVAPPSENPETPPDAAPPDAPGYPPPAPGYPPGDPFGPGGPPPKEPPKPPFWPNLLPWIGVYCTGYACCASHENPCTGRRHDAGCSNCDCCDCDCCDDGCCCDCDCNC